MSLKKRKTGLSNWYNKKGTQESKKNECKIFFVQTLHRIKLKVTKRKSQ